MTARHAPRKADPIGEDLASGKLDPASVRDLMRDDHAVVDAVVDGLSDQRGRVRFGCAKALIMLSEENPNALLLKTDSIIRLLESDNRILKWNAIAIIGNMAGAVSGREGRALLRRLYGFLSSGELATANNAIAALAKMGRAFPGEREEIVSRLLAIEQAIFPTEECRNIAIGKAILALQTFPLPATSARKAMDLARRQTGNRRKSTAAQARRLLVLTT